MDEKLHRKKKKTGYLKESGPVLVRESLLSNVRVVVLSPSSNNSALVCNIDFDALLASSSLQKLNLEDNQGAYFFPQFTRALKKNTTLRSLNLKRTNIGGNNADLIFASIATTKISSLNLAENYLYHNKGKPFASLALLKPLQLAKLNLSGNGLGSVGWRSSSNPLDSIDPYVFHEGLQAASCCSKLTMKWNDFGAWQDHAVVKLQILGDFMAENSTIRRLNFQYNGLMAQRDDVVEDFVGKMRLHESRLLEEGNGCSFHNFEGNFSSISLKIAASLNEVHQSFSKVDAFVMKQISAVLFVWEVSGKSDLWKNFPIELIREIYLCLRKRAGLLAF